MLRAIALLVNPSAGGGLAARVLPRVQGILRDAGLLVRTEQTRDMLHARDLAGTAARAGDTVITLGGDGLAGCAAGALREVPDAVLGILPGGRGNDIARYLGIPGDIAQAAGALATGVERSMDLGDIGGRTFVGVASTGFDAVANRIANDAPRMLGRGVYAYGALGALSRWQPERFSLELDGRPLGFTGYSVAVANTGMYGGGMRIAPGAVVDDGLLDVITIADMPRTRFLRLLPTVFTGGHVARPEVEAHRAREVRIACERSTAIYADGDPIARLPVTIRAVPKAVRVMLPAELAA